MLFVIVCYANHATSKQPLLDHLGRLLWGLDGHGLAYFGGPKDEDNTMGKLSSQLSGLSWTL